MKVRRRVIVEEHSNQDPIELLIVGILRG